VELFHVPIPRNALSIRSISDDPEDWCETLFWISNVLSNEVSYCHHGRPQGQVGEQVKIKINYSIRGLTILLKQANITIYRLLLKNLSF